MAMNNTYNRQVAANPTGLNPNQRYIEQYDAMAELTKQMNQFGQQALEVFAKADYEAAGAEMRHQRDLREMDVEKARRMAELNKNPRAREAAFEKSLAAINKKYSKGIDSRWQEDYEKQTQLSDQRHLLDLRINATKDLIQQTKDYTFDRIEQAAKQVVGAPAGYVKMLDAGVENDLKSMLERGSITQLEYDKALRNYGESKVFNALNDRLLKDPEGLALDLQKNAYGMKADDLKSWQKKVDAELKINDLKNQTALNNQIETDALEVLDMLRDKKTPPQNLLNRLPEKTRDAMQKARAYAVTGDDVPTDPQVYSFLNDMRQSNALRFKNINLYDYAGDLAADDLAALRQAQNSIIITMDGSAKVNPTVKRNDALMKMAYDSLSLSTPEEKYEFQKMFDAEVRGFMSEKGRVPTDAEQDAIVKKLRKDVAVRGWFSWGGTTATELDEDDEPYVPFEEIPEKTKENINKIIDKNKNANILKNLSEEEKNQMIEDMAGVYERPRNQWTAATTDVINKWLKRATKEE